MYFIYLQKLLRRGRMIIQCLQLTEALENPQKTSSAFGLGGFLRIFHASARCKHRIIPVPTEFKSGSASFYLNLSTIWI